MRPVNLLPPDLRPRRGTNGRQGSGYVALGVLAALVLLTLVYVVVAGQAGSREADSRRVAAEARQAQARAAALGPYAAFARIERTRSASVKALAGARFDWERLMRELALVLPEGTWLTEVDASVRPEEPGDGGAATTGTTGPAAKIVGCAPRQADVARFMVRLRGMNRVTDVTLTESAKAAADAGAGAPVPGPGGASQGDCGRLYSFDLVVAFEAVEPPPTGAPGAKGAPASLGGGS